MSNRFAAQSSLPVPDFLLHVAVVPDENGRWAVARGLSRAAGHRAGVDALRRIVRAAPSLWIGTLTIHALSTDNWRRPRAEALSILDLVAEFLASELTACRAEGVRVTVLGRRDRLPDDVRRTLETAERETAAGAVLHLRLAVDYSSRDEILAAVGGAAATRASVSAALGADGPPSGAVPDLDLLVRTGGEVRLGDFLLWECAHAELVFVDTPWPEFGADDLAAAVAEYRRRARRCGGLPTEGAGAQP